MTDTPLSPCPICGGAPVRNGRGTSGGVLCYGKDVPGLMHRLQVYGDGQADADATWNHRAAAGDIEAMIDRALNAEIRTNGFSWTLQELFNDRASRSTLNQAHMRNAMRQILALGATSTRQTPDAGREAAMLAQAREAAAQTCDARAKKAGHPDVAMMERHYAKVIRQGDGDDYDAVQSALIALRLAALDSRAGDAGEGWKLVPVEPSLEMVQAGYENGYGSRKTIRAVWAAMISASAATPAPAVDAVPAGEVERRARKIVEQEMVTLPARNFKMKTWADQEALVKSISDMMEAAVRAATRAVAEIK